MTLKNAMRESMEDNQEINLSLIFEHFLYFKKTILFLTFLSGVLSILYSLSLQNYYTSSALLKLSDTSETTFSQTSSALSGLASLAGVSVGGASSGLDKNQLAIETVKSRDFFQSIVTDDIKINIHAAKSFDSVTRAVVIDEGIYSIDMQQWINADGEYVDPSFLDFYRSYLRGLKIAFNKRTGFIEINFEHLSPVFAANFLNHIISNLNQQMRAKDFQDSEESLNYLLNLKSQNLSLQNSVTALIQRELQKQMLTEIREEYFVEVVDKPFIPDRKSRPSRALITVALTFIGGVLSLILTFFLRKRL